VTDGTVRVAAVQAAPVYLDLGATVDKAIGLIEQAAADGVRLIGFPETWIPGYPWWVWLGAPSWGLQFQKRYHENALRRDSREMAALCAAAKRNKINVVLGYAERDGGSLYMSQSILGENGRALVHRRKLKPARTERQVFGEGDGGDLAVTPTSIGRVGAMCCAEHFQPLLKFAMYAEDEQIHVAAWPGFSLMRGRAYLNGPEAASVATQMYAIEGQCFALAATTVNDEAMLSVVCDTDDKRAMLTVEGKAAAGGASMVYGPDGSPLAEYIPEDQEGLVYADIDLSNILLAKTAADPLGHFSRPDVVRLMVNRKHAPAIVPYASAFDTVAGAAADT
jgi:nitrilase